MKYNTNYIYKIIKMKKFDIATASSEILKILTSFITTNLNNIDKVAIPFSGSLDSSLVAFLVKSYTNTQISLYTIGKENCYDFSVAQKSASLLGLSSQHKEIVINLSTVKKNLSIYKSITNDDDKVSISYTLPFFILLQKMKESHIMTGHGADTLFGGFHKYMKSISLKKDIEQNYLNLIKKIPHREIRISEHFGKKLLLPFCDKRIADYVLRLPEDILIRHGMRKYILRHSALNIGLPKEITYKPKKAFQYSSGIIKYLRQVW